MKVGGHDSPKNLTDETRDLTGGSRPHWPRLHGDLVDDAFHRGAEALSFTPAVSRLTASPSPRVGGGAPRGTASGLLLGPPSASAAEDHAGAHARASAPAFWWRRGCSAATDFGSRPSPDGQAAGRQRPRHARQPENRRSATRDPPPRRATAHPAAGAPPGSDIPTDTGSRPRDPPCR